jgi:hypothetical protein
MYVAGDPVNFTDRRGLFYSAAELLGNGNDGSNQDFDICMLNPYYPGCGPVSANKKTLAPPSPEDEWDNFSADCQKGLKEAMPGTPISAMDLAVNRAVSNWNVLETAGEANGIDPAMLAAIGIRETGFRNISQTNGLGTGIFQITAVRLNFCFSG